MFLIQGIVFTPARHLVGTSWRENLLVDRAFQPYLGSCMP
jgi:hypothetical protein